MRPNVVLETILTCFCQALGDEEKFSVKLLSRLIFSLGAGITYCKTNGVFMQDIESPFVTATDIEILCKLTDEQFLQTLGIVKDSFTNIFNITKHGYIDFDPESSSLYDALILVRELYNNIHRSRSIPILLAKDSD